MREKVLVVGTVMLLCASTVLAQNYTSLASGSWTTAANWNNTSGWGTSTPPIDGSHGSGTATVNHNLSIATNYILGGATLSIASGATVTINGNMTVNGGSTVNVSGTLNITGALNLFANFNVLPGGSVVVNGNVVVNNSQYLNIGTGANPPPYGDMAIKGNLQQISSGDVQVNKNGRLAVFGNVTSDPSGGSKIRVNNGGQVYVHGNIAYTGGGDDIVNSNPTSPFGLYVNGTISNTGGGATTTSNTGSQATMQSTNSTFFSWVQALPGSPLPITLLFFKATSVTSEAIEFKWATASELKFDYFVLQSSTDGVNFNDQAMIQGRGNSNVRIDYGYVVGQPVIGKSYWRLKSVDFDGFTETFNVVGVNVEASKKMMLFPNPATDSKVNLNFNFVPTSGMQLVITDLNGSVIATQTITSEINLLELSLQPGTYLVKVNSTEFSGVTRILVK